MELLERMSLCPERCLWMESCVSEKRQYGCLEGMMRHSLSVPSRCRTVAKTAISMKGKG
jgi:hypothetical protein